MAQASSAQREPSMEEILASIRKIIEDNDAGEPESSQDAASAPAEGANANDSGAAEVESFRAELTQEGNEVRRQTEAEEPAPRLADIQESLKTESSAISEPPAGAEPDEAEAETEGPSAFGSNAFSDTQETDSPPALPQEPPDAAPEPRAAAQERNVDWTDAPTQPAGESRTPIISDVASRKVAAAFEELNEVFEASRRKSFDEMAEEMLRPMLREWLDNNLPTLVEKMVREEIERVARGGGDQ